MPGPDSFWHVFFFTSNPAVNTFWGPLVGPLLYFNLTGLAPKHFTVAAFQAPPAWNYTTFLDLVFIALIAVMLWRFLTTGGPRMLRAMAQPGGGSRSHEDHAHMEHHHHQ